MNPHWEVPLGSPPQVAAIGRNAHGFEPTDRYCLPDLWSLHLYGYEASLKVDDLELPIRPGYLGLTPPGRTMEYRYLGISVHIYIHFRLDASEPTARIPAMQDLGADYDAVYRRLYAVLNAPPARVEAGLWDLLWNLTSAPTEDSSEAQMHPAVRKASDLIARNLAEPLRVEDLAHEVGISPSYLARLFQEAFGETVIAYIRNQRMERARHLLERSTLPIKAIAASVGIPDLQHFNKTVRGRYSASPRALRHGAPNASSG